MTVQDSGVRHRLLVYTKGQVRTVLLHGSRWVIGRAEDCEVQIEDPTASRHHLVLERDPEGFTVRDLGGTNATLLNGRPIGSGRLAVGQTLLVGMTRLTLDVIQEEPKVRVVTDPNQTSVVFQHYLGEIVERPASANEPLADRTELLRRLETAMQTLATEQEIAAAMLGILLDQVQYGSGLVARFLPDRSIRVLSSLRRDGGGALEVADRVLEELQVRPEAFFLEDRDDRSKSRLVVPLGEGPAGLLFLTDLQHGESNQERTLAFAAAFGRLLWSRISQWSESAELRTQLMQLRSAHQRTRNPVLASSRLVPLRSELARAASHDLPLLLHGEHGTEAEDLLRYMHSLSKRSGTPFVTLLCDTQAPEDIEAALFGAHPTAESSGLLIAAHGGTLMIERPELMPEHVQRRLAATLRRGRVEDGTGEGALVDTRLALVRRTAPDGSAPELSQDLLQLVGALSFAVPPLRESPEDISSLSELFLDEMGPGPEGAPRTIAVGAKRTLLEYHWPGNTRQLRQVVETAATRAGRQHISKRHLPQEVTEPDPSHMPSIPSLNEVERLHIARVLEAMGGSRTKAARVLGIANSTLYEKMRRYELATRK